MPGPSAEVRNVSTNHRNLKYKQARFEVSSCQGVGRNIASSLRRDASYANKKTGATDVFHAPMEMKNTGDEVINGRLHKTKRQRGWHVH